MSNLKKTFFLLLAFTTQTTFPSFSIKALVAAATLATTITTAECATTYNDEATQKLWHAVVEDDLIAAQKAIEEKANPNGTEEEKFLLIAIKLNHLAMVKFLIFHKADINVRCNSLSGQTPLIVACIYERPEIVDMLLRGNANYALCDKEYERSALEWTETMATLHASTGREGAYLRCNSLIRKKIFSDKLNTIIKTKK